ncbi:MAG: TIR domain-containing protein [Terriglobales bacterium]
MLDPLEQSVLLAIRRLTSGTYQPTDGQAVAEELERQGCRPEDDMTLNHLLMRLRDDGYISPKAYFGAEGLKAIVSVDLTIQGREIADQSDQPQVPSDAKSTDNDQISAADPTKVMVVHGRDDDARRAMFGFLEAIGLVPLEWGELVAATGSAAPYIGQVLKKAFETAKAVVVLFTPDDEAWLKEAFHKPDDRPDETQLTPQARPNVLFEAGMALGVHPDRTVLVELGKLRSFSDIYGRHVIRIDHTDKPLREIAKRLKTAGCAVDESRVDWNAVGFPDHAVNGDTAEASGMPESSVGPNVSQTPWLTNPLVGRFKIRQYASPLAHDDKGTVFRVVVAAGSKPTVSELDSVTKAAVKEALSGSSLEKWGRSASGLLYSNTPTEWVRVSPSSGQVATFERDWGMSATQGSVLHGRATLELPSGFQFGMRPVLTLDVIERPADAGDSQRRLSLALTDLHELLHVLGRAAVDEIASVVFPMLCVEGTPAIVGPNYEISFGDRSLNATIALPSSFERPANAVSNPWAEINTPEDSDSRDLTARDAVIRKGLEKILRSNEYDGMEEAIVKLPAPTPNT